MYDDPGGDDYDATRHDDGEGSGLVGTTLRNVAIVLGLCLAMVWISGGFSSGTSRPGTPEDLPAAAIQSDRAQRLTYVPDEIIVPAGPSGHFLVDIDVNGTPVRFLVDTGATMVILTARDAKMAGLPIRDLDYNKRFHTANGEVRLATVTLRDMQLGSQEIRDVAAAVTQAHLDISLLGMSFLGRLSGYEVRPEGLVLRF